MKTIAIFLFSALALTACATDDAQVDQDMPGRSHAAQIEPSLSPAAEEWARQLLTEQQHVDTNLDGAGGDWAEEVVFGDKIYTLIHVHGEVAQLLDADGERVVVPACHACESGRL